MCSRYPFTIEGFLERMEAFLLNSNKNSLTLEELGQFEQSLLVESQANSKAAAVIKESSVPKFNRDVYYIHYFIL